MELLDKDLKTLKSLKDLLMRDVDESQIAQLSSYRNELIYEIKKMGSSIAKLEEQKRLLNLAKTLLAASEQDPLGATFDMLIHNIDREIAAITPIQKEEKKLDLERRLATIYGKKNIASLIGTLINDKDI